MSFLEILWSCRKSSTAYVPSIQSRTSKGFRKILKNSEHRVRYEFLVTVFIQVSPVAAYRGVALLRGPSTEYFNSVHEQCVAHYLVAWD